MISDAQLTRLMDIGLAAAHRGWPGPARDLFQGLLAYRPGHAPALIGLALTHMAVGELERAEAILRDEVLARRPEDAEAQALLGLTLAFGGRAAEAAAALELVPREGPAGALVRAFEAEGA